MSLACSSDTPIREAPEVGRDAGPGGVKAEHPRAPGSPQLERVLDAARDRDQRARADGLPRPREHRLHLSFDHKEGVEAICTPTRQFRMRSMELPSEDTKVGKRAPEPERPIRRPEALAAGVGADDGLACRQAAFGGHAGDVPLDLETV